VNLTLVRFSYAPTETEGVLYVASHRLATIEKPWVPFVNVGGKPFESCVPDGTYRLRPWVRATNNQSCFILEAPTLGVYMRETDRPAGIGRYLCLIHTGNYADDVVGCIAVGMSRGIMLNPRTGKRERAVLGSTGAIQLLRTELQEGTHQLTIASIGGARGTA
jgi:hypothetical protein